MEGVEEGGRGVEEGGRGVEEGGREGEGEGRGRGGEGLTIITLLQLLNWKSRYGDLEETLAASQKETKRLQGKERPRKLASCKKCCDANSCSSLQRSWVTLRSS